MPQMSGIDFIKKVREVDNDYMIKVILISAYIINSIFIDQNNKLKIHKIIEKPISLKVLETEIKMLIDES
jgi:response regulator RpfG family c-di-GMP phosphodiesterase